MRAAPLAVLLAALALLAGACSGDDDDEGAAATTAAASTAASEGAAAPLTGAKADPAPGKVLMRFVKAAGRGDAETMWSLLTEPTQASIGPTFEDFRGDAANTFENGVGSLAGSAQVTLSARLPEDWAVAAVSGERLVEGAPERFSYGAALLPENGKLKLELGGVVITSYKPAPLSTTEETQPTLAAKVGAGGDLTDVRMWLDGKPFPARRGENDTPFTASLTGVPARPLAPGLHEVVVFAATGETATASAWPFTVSAP